MKKKGKYRWYIVFVVFFVFLAMVLVTGGLVLKDDNAGKFYASPDAVPLLETVGKAALKGEEAQISCEDVNSFLALMVEKEKEKEGGSSVEQIFLQIREDQKIAAYTPMVLEGVHVGVTSVSSLSFSADDGLIQIDVEEIRFGRMPIPVKMALSLLSSKFPDGVSVQGNRVLIETRLFEISIPETDLVLPIEDLRVENGNFVLRTADLGQEAQKYFEGIMNQGIEDFSGFLQDFWERFQNR